MLDLRSRKMTRPRHCNATGQHCEVKRGRVLNVAFEKGPSDTDKVPKGSLSRVELSALTSSLDSG
jgi:hypothetical protein